MSNIYDDIYKEDSYYWGFTPSHTCFRILKECPPTKKLRLLDIGCGEGRNAVFFARNGYDVTAFDAAEEGVNKTKKLAEQLGVAVNVFRDDINTFRLTENFDVIFSTGVLHYMLPKLRKEIFDNYREHTLPNGVHMLSVFVQKPFIPPAPEKEVDAQKWSSGELFEHYSNWKIEYCNEEIMDCMSSGMPHKHAVNRILARRVV